MRIFGTFKRLFFRTGKLSAFKNRVGYPALEKNADNKSNKKYTTSVSCRASCIKIADGR